MQVNLQKEQKLDVQLQENSQKEQKLEHERQQVNLQKQQQQQQAQQLDVQLQAIQYSSNLVKEWYGSRLGFKGGLGGRAGSQIVFVLVFLIRNWITTAIWGDSRPKGPCEISFEPEKFKNKPI
jgi:hypothetical protein